MNQKGQSRQGHGFRGPGLKFQGRKGPVPKGPLAFTRHQSVLPIRGGSGPSRGYGPNSGNSQVPLYDHRPSASFMATANVTNQELKQEQARMNEELHETRRELRKALDTVQQLQADVRSLREEAAAETRKAEDPVRILADVASGQLHVAVANHVFDENELLRSARELIEDDNSIVINIKLLIAGLIILGRDQQAYEQAVDDKIKELQCAVEYLGRALEDNPSIWHLKRSTSQALHELGAVRADICKHRTTDIGRIVSVKSLVDRLVEAVGDIEKRVYNDRSIIREAQEHAKSEQADINGWTSRFLNLLVQGPGKREDETLRRYKDTLFDRHTKIQADDRMPDAQKSRYAQQYEELQDMASNTKETLDTIESLRKSVSDPAPPQRMLASESDHEQQVGHPSAQPVGRLDAGSKRKAENPSCGELEEKRLRFDKP